MFDTSHPLAAARQQMLLPAAQHHHVRGTQDVIKLALARVEGLEKLGNV
jgi:hypothetical protein